MAEAIETNGRAGGTPLDVEQAVRQRYSTASQAAQPALCCPVQYDGRYLEVLPPELIECDYGCGDPSGQVAHGETVLDLGSGSGKICYIASQIVGPTGRVIGVDMNDDMLDLARKHQCQVGKRIGHNNIEFRKGRIQDLALDLERFEAHLRQNPVCTADDWLKAQTYADQMRRTAPMIASDSIDVVLSNCVLNLVEPSGRRRLFEEMYRVLDRGGRAVISDIVSDEPVPETLRNDPQLWSGCISGAFVEHELLEAFAGADFYGIEILSRQAKPWATVEGIQFRSVVVRAYKGKQGPCLEHNQAVIYNGPWKSVTDDDGHTLHRGIRSAVCGKTYEIYNRPPYADEIIAVPPHEPVRAEDAQPFDYPAGAVRDPHQTKGLTFNKTQLPTADCCGPDGCF